MNTAQKIKIVRESVGLKQSEFGDAFGVNSGAVGHWETGRNKFPGRYVKTLYEKFNVNPAWFEGDENVDEPIFLEPIKPNSSSRKTSKDGVSETKLEGFLVELFDVLSSLSPEKQDVVNRAAEFIFDAFVETRKTRIKSIERKYRVVERNGNSIVVGDVNIGDNNRIGDVFGGNRE